MTNTSRLSGKIIKLMLDKGFGFVQDTEGKEHFFHRSGFQGQVEWETLRIGEPLTFVVESSPKGSRAEKLLREA